MIVCADDFGMAESIDQAVLELVARGKLTAVSCAVSHPACRADSIKTLLAHAAKMDVGLHLVLTDEARPLVDSPTGSLCNGDGFYKFGPLLCRSWFRHLNREEIKIEIAAQYDRFNTLAGRRPDFIDGHLHVHQFPVIREAVLDFICEVPRTERPYVRNTRMSPAQIIRTGPSLPKNILIGRPGSVFRRKALRRGLATNTGFAGIYNYAPGSEFSTLFGTFLASLRLPNDILVVHPGAEPWRKREYDALLNWNPGPLMPNRFVWNRK